MGSATFTIVGDASGVARMLAVVRQDNKRTVDVVVADWRRASGSIARSYEQIRQAALRGAAERTRSERRVAEAQTAAAHATERVTATAARARTDTERRAANERIAHIRRAADAYVATERRMTSTARTEAQARDRLGRFTGGGAVGRAGRMLASGAGRLAGAAGTALEGVMGQVGAARQTFASRERLINGALYQAGITGGGAASSRARIAQFLASEQGRGISGDDLAQALNRTQTEFSVLSRPGGMESFLRNATLARNTYQDVGEVTRVGAMLANAGLDPTAQRQTLLAMTGMAQRGAIELGDVTRTAMGPLQQRIAQATANIAPGDEAARAHATQRAVLQTFAEMEVGRGLGMTPRALGNATSALEGSLQSDVTQQRMLGNIRDARGINEAQRESLINTLFARDSRGRQRLRGEYQTTFGLAGALTQQGISTTAAQNIFAGGGQGNPQSLQRNWRGVLAAFMGEGNESVARMMSGAGTDFTEQNVAAGEQMTLAETQTRIVAQNEQHIAAIMANTTALRAFEQLAAFRASDPVKAALANQVGGVAGELAAGSATQRGIGGFGANGMSIGEGVQTIAGHGLQARIARAAGTEVGQAHADDGWLDRLRGNMTGARARETLDLGSRISAALPQGVRGGQVQISDESLQRLARALRENPQRVEIDAIQAAQARAVGASGANAPPPESRNP